MAIKALDAVTDKIYDERLAATVADQELQYSRLHDRAVQKLAEGKAQIGIQAREEPGGRFIARMPWRI